MNELERMRDYVKSTPIPEDEAGHTLTLTEAIALAHADRDLYVKLLRAFEYGRAKGFRAAQKAGTNG